MSEYKQRRKPTGMLVGGLVINIFAGVFAIIAALVLFIIFGIAIALGATAGAAIAGEEGAQQAAENIKITPEMSAMFTVAFILLIYSIIALPLTIVALVLCKKAKNRKGCIAPGVIALIACVPGIVIPLELIAGIRLLTLKDKDFEFDPNYWHD